MNMHGCVRRMGVYKYSRGIFARFVRYALNINIRL